MVKDARPNDADEMTDPVARRLVFHVAGYDPMSAETAHHRFTRELGRFRTTWGTSAEAGPLAIGDDVASWTARATGPGWAVEAEVRWLRWDDVMARLHRLSTPVRLGRGLAAFADFARGGALRGYARHNWRYALFFLYPVVLLLLFVALGTAVGMMVARLTGWTSLGLLAGGAAFLATLQWARRGMRLDHLFDDWIFAREHIRHPDPVLLARLDRIAADVVAAARGGEVDEVLMIGHSLGAVLAVEIMDRALKLDPALGEAGAAVSLATVGSSVPKIGLHRDASRLREALGRVGSAERLSWVDYQAYADVMNFHKLHPVRGLGAGTRGPLVRLVPIRKVLHPHYYRKIRTNLLRVHNQFVSGNDVRSIYDYFMLVCGPCTLETLARAENGAADCVAPDGSLVREPPRRYVARPGLDRLP
jgi:hypothetical protein